MVFTEDFQQGLVFIAQLIKYFQLGWHVKVILSAVTAFFNCVIVVMAAYLFVMLIFQAN